MNLQCKLLIVSSNFRYSLVMSSGSGLLNNCSSVHQSFPRLHSFNH
ncbi:hypothetical protein VP424E501_P0159 [Vibrio phage 424E50-1]|nr:hypothetical protein VP424E501_P0159 [Vibrio phage 424E50-1]